MKGWIFDAGLFLAGLCTFAGSTHPAIAQTERVVLVPQIGHTADIRSIAFSGDGHFAATVDENRKLNVWDARSRRLLYSRVMPTRDARILRFSHDASRIYVTGDDGFVEFDLGSEHARVVRGDLRPLALFGDDHSYLRAGERGRGIVIGTVDSGNEVLISGTDDPKAGNLSTFAITRSHQFAVLEFDGSSHVLIVHIPSRAVRARLPVAKYPVEAAAISDDGALVALINKADAKGQRLVVYSVADGRQVFSTEAQAGGRMRVLAFAPGGRRLVVGGEDLGGVKMFNVDAPREIATMPHFSRVTALDFAGTPPRLAIVSRDGVEMRELPAAQEHRRSEERVGLNARLLRTPDGHYYAILRRDGALSVRSSADDSPVFPTKLGEFASAVFAGGRNIVFQRDGALWMRDLTDGRETRLADGVAQSLGDLSASNDGAVIAFRFRFASKAVTVLRRTEGAIQKQEIAFSHDVEHLALSPDGRSLFMHGEDNTLRVYDTVTGELVTTLDEGVKAGTTSRARFSADGRTLAYLTDNVIRIWHGPPWGSAQRLAFSEWVSDFDFHAETGRFWVATNRGIFVADAANPKGRMALSETETESVIGMPAAVGTVMAITRGGMRQTFQTQRAQGRVDRLAGAEAGLSQLHEASGERYLAAYINDRARARMRLNVWSADRGTMICDLESVLAGFHGEQALVVLGGGVIELVGLDDCQPRSQFRLTEPISIDHAAVLPDGNLLVAGPSELAVVEPGTGRTIRTHKIDASPWHTRVIMPASGMPRVLYIGYDAKIIHVMTVPAFTDDMRISLGNEHLGFVQALPGTDYLAVASFAEHNVLRVWNLNTRAIEREVVLPAGSWFTTAAALDLVRDRLHLGAIDGRIRTLEWKSGKPIRELHEHAAAITAILVRGNGDLFAASDDGAVRLYRGSVQRAAATFVHFSDREWLVAIDEGYFNASRRATDQIVFRVGRTARPLNQFYDVFYRPDIVEAKLKGEDIAPLIRITIDEALAAPPPEVEFAGSTKPAGGNRSTIAFRVKSAGGGIGDVRVFHNGKLVLSDALRPPPVAETPARLSEATPEAVTQSLRGLAFVQRRDPARVAIQKPDLVETSVTVEPVPGENEVAVVAFNRTNSVQSEVRSIAFVGDGAPVPSRLFVLTVGIDQYAEAPLKFAVKDARDIGKSVVELARTLYGERIQLTELQDAQAGKAGIIGALERLTREARPWDSVMFFVASHGMMRGDEYVMATYDYRRGAPSEWFLTTTEIVELSKKIPALDQVFIFDTCHAGGLNTMVTGLYDARMTVLAKNMGLHILTSASKTQEAIDGYQGNGLFTHAVLQAFGDPRTDTNNDNRVSVTELAAGARQRVLEIARRIRYQQSPVAAHFGKDRALYELAK